MSLWLGGFGICIDLCDSAAFLCSVLLGDAGFGVTHRLGVGVELLGLLTVIHDWVVDFGWWLSSWVVTSG